MRSGSGSGQGSAGRTVLSVQGVRVGDMQGAGSAGGRRRARAKPRKAGREETSRRGELLSLSSVTSVPSPAGCLQPGCGQRRCSAPFRRLGGCSGSRAATACNGRVTGPGFTGTYLICILLQLKPGGLSNGLIPQPASGIALRDAWCRPGGLCTPPSRPPTPLCSFLLSLEPTDAPASPGWDSLPPGAVKGGAGKLCGSHVSVPGKGEVWGIGGIPHRGGWLMGHRSGLTCGKADMNCPSIRTAKIQPGALPR